MTRLTKSELLIRDYSRLNKNIRKEEVRRYLASDSRMSVVNAYLGGNKSIRQVAKDFNISKSAVQRCIRKFASENPEIVEVASLHYSLKPNAMTKENPACEEQPKDIEALQAEVKSLRKQLEIERLRTHSRDVMIDVAEEMFNIPIRKKAGTKQ